MPDSSSDPTTSAHHASSLSPTSRPRSSGDAPASKHSSLATSPTGAAAQTSSSTRSGSPFSTASAAVPNGSSPTSSTATQPGASTALSSAKSAVTHSHNNPATSSSKRSHPASPTHSPAVTSSTASTMPGQHSNTPPPSSPSSAQLATMLATAYQKVDTLKAELAAMHHRAERAELLLSSLQQGDDSSSSSPKQQPGQMPDRFMKTIMDYELRTEAAEKARDEANQRLQGLLTQWGDIDRYFSVLDIRAADARATFTRLLSSLPNGAPVSSIEGQLPNLPAPYSSIQGSHQQNGSSSPSTSTMPSHRRSTISSAISNAHMNINPALNGPHPPSSIASTSHLSLVPHSSLHQTISLASPAAASNGTLPSLPSLPALPSTRAPHGISAPHSAGASMAQGGPASAFQALPLPPPPSASTSANAHSGLPSSQGQSQPHLSSLKRGRRRHDDWDLSGVSKRSRLGSNSFSALAPPAGLGASSTNGAAHNDRMSLSPSHSPHMHASQQHSSAAQQQYSRNGVQSSGPGVAPQPYPPSHSHHAPGHPDDHRDRDRYAANGRDAYDSAYGASKYPSRAYERNGDGDVDMDGSLERGRAGYDRREREYREKVRYNAQRPRRPRSTSRSSRSSLSIDEMLLAATDGVSPSQSQNQAQQGPGAYANGQGRYGDRYDRESLDGRRGRSGTVDGIADIRAEVGPHREPPSLQTYQTHIFAPPVTGAPVKRAKSGSGSAIYNANAASGPSQGNSPAPSAPGAAPLTSTGTLPVNPPSAATLATMAGLGPGGFPPTNEAGQRICRQCGQPGRYKEGKCVEKWGPGPEGPGTVCDRCRKKMKRVERRGTLDSQQALAHQQAQAQLNAQLLAQSQNQSSSQNLTHTQSYGGGALSPSYQSTSHYAASRERGRERERERARERSRSRVSSNVGDERERPSGIDRSDTLIIERDREREDRYAYERESDRYNNRPGSGSGASDSGYSTATRRPAATNGAHPSASQGQPSTASNSQRRQPTPPLITSISTREQYASGEGEDDAEGEADGEGEGEELAEDGDDVDAEIARTLPASQSRLAMISKDSRRPHESGWRTPTNGHAIENGSAKTVNGHVNGAKGSPYTSGWPNNHSSANGAAPRINGLLATAQTSAKNKNRPVSRASTASVHSSRSGSTSPTVRGGAASRNKAQDIDMDDPDADADADAEGDPDAEILDAVDALPPRVNGVTGRLKVEELS